MQPLQNRLGMGFGDAEESAGGAFGAALAVPTGLPDEMIQIE